MAQSKKSNNELRQLLLKSGAVTPGSSEGLHNRSIDRVASQANAITSRRRELNKLPMIVNKNFGSSK